MATKIKKFGNRFKNEIKNPLFRTRMRRLVEEINFQMQRILKGDNDDLLEIIHLYYDQ